MDYGRSTQYTSTFALSLGTMTIGVIWGWLVPVVPFFWNKEINFEMSDTEYGRLYYISAIAFIPGSFITRFISDYMGRRITILISAPIFLIGMLLAVFASNAWMLYATFLFWGIGIGIVLTVSSVYLAEIADKEIRGSLLVGTLFMRQLGTLLVIVIGPYMSYRSLNYSMLLLPILFFLICLLIPESPYYYIKEKKYDLAMNVLLRLRGYKAKIDTELAQLKSDVNKEMSRPSSVFELLTGRQYRKAIIISVGLESTKLFMGVTSLEIYFSNIVLKAEVNLVVSTGIIYFGLVKFLFGIISSVIIDRVGRRRLLIYTYLGTGFCLSIAGVYFFLEEVIKVEDKTLEYYSTIPLVAIITASAISVLGFNSIQAIIEAEIFPLNVRAIAMTSINIYTACLGLLAGKVFKIIKDSCGVYIVFFLFCSICCVGALFTYFVLTETNRKSLRDIQDILQGIDKNVEQSELNQNVPVGKCESTGEMENQNSTRF